MLRVFFERHEDGIYVSSIEDVQRMWGSKTTPQDMSHKIRKEASGMYFISYANLRRRLRVLEKKKQRVDNGIMNITEVLKQKTMGDF